MCVCPSDRALKINRTHVFNMSNRERSSVITQVHVVLNSTLQK